MEEKAKEFKSALLSLDRIAVHTILSKQLKLSGNIPFIENILVPTLESIGFEWEKGILSLSQLYMSSRICEELIDEIITTKEKGGHHKTPLAIVTVNDYHTLGKRIVYSMLRAAGYNISDYGRIMAAEELKERIKNDQIQILLISVLMLPSALSIEKVSEDLKGLFPDLKFIVGGAPFRFDKNLWKEINVDAVATNSSEIFKLLSKMGIT